MSSIKYINPNSFGKILGWYGLQRRMACVFSVAMGNTDKHENARELNAIRIRAF
jgi:hypothetical protein